MLIFEDKVPGAIRSQFIDKVKAISQDLGINPNWLMAVINFESAGTFSSTIKNKYSNAVGLIQFMPNTAKGLGTSTYLLENMGAIAQLDYVKKYYKQFKTANSYIDLYFATFFPLAMGKASSFVLQTASIPASLIAKQNPVFDTNKDGKVTKAEIEKVMLSRIPSELRHFISSKKKSLTGVAILLIVLTIYTVNKKWD